MFFRAAVEAIKRGLQKTAEVFGAGFRSILHGRTLSEELIDEVERTLVSAEDRKSTRLNSSHVL